MRWTIGRRMAIGYCGLVALIAGVSGFAVSGLRAINREHERIQTELTPMASDAAEVERLVGRSGAAVRAMLIPGLSKQQQETFAGERGAAQAELAKVLDRMGGHSMGSIDEEFGRLRSQVKEWATVSDEVVRLAGSDENMPAMKMLATEAAPRATKMFEAITAMIDEEAKLDATPERKALLGAMADFRGSLGMATAAVRAYLLTGETKFRTDFDNRWKLNESGFTRMTAAAALLTETQAKQCETIRATRPEFAALPPKMFSIREGPDWNRAVSLQIGKGEELGREIDKGTKSLAARASDELHKGSEAIAANVVRSQFTLIGASAAAVGVAIAAGLAVTRSITKPVRDMVDRLKDIATGDGDLTRRVESSRDDEVGELARWFNTFVVKVHDIMCIIAGSSQNVAAAATEIAASAEESTRGIGNQSEQMERLSAATTQMSASLTEVARNIDTARDHAKRSSNDAAESGAVIRETVKDMHEVSRNVDASAGTINELGRLSEEIGRLVGVITDIADQTNLLALNAAIEAARAGEHGRGFAVVADEVRKLADRTTRSTGEIVSSIGTIRGKTTEAVTTISARRDMAQEGIRRADRAGTCLEKIVGAADELAGVIANISASTTEQTSAAEAIRQGLEQVVAVTRECTQAAACSAEAATNLAQQAAETDRLVAKFKLNRRQRDAGPPKGGVERRSLERLKQRVADLSEGKR